MLTVYTRIYSRKWWVLALRGVTAMFVGLVAIIVHFVMAFLIMWYLPSIGLLFGVYALVGGILAVILGMRIRREVDHWWAWLLEGLAGVVSGVIVDVWIFWWIFWPANESLVLLPYLIAVWGLVTGIFEILAAMHIRKVFEGERLLMLDGVLSILLGVFLCAYMGVLMSGAFDAIIPSPDGSGISLLFGAYAILFGVLLFVLGRRLQKLGDALKRQLMETD